MVYQAKNRLIFFLFLSIGVVACENSMQEVKQLTNQKNLPQQSAQDITFIYSDSSLVKAKIEAPVLNNYSKENSSITVFPKGAQVSFYNAQLKVISTIKGNYAVYDQQKQTIDAKGNVVAVNEKGETLNTEQLRWDQAKEKITSHEFVKITTPDKIIMGTGFESDQNMNHYKIFNIKGIIQVEKQSK